MGNFSNTTGEAMGIDITTDRVELSADKKSYANGGKINVTVNIDNTVDNAVELTNAVINLTVDEKQFKLIGGDSDRIPYASLGKETKVLRYVLEALPQNDLTAGTIYISVTGTQTLADGTLSDF
ncbi:MAG: hypothetical protein L6V93_22920 [Clostridiales bacterium]|nr:MAG: hypothetical protein L6V93_22920 [Clostridiales bacterium]